MSNKEFIISITAFICAVAVLTAGSFAIESLTDSPGSSPVPEAAAELPEDIITEEQEVPEGQENEAPGLQLHLSLDDTQHKGYISGYEDGTFRPENTITRAEAAAMLRGLLAEEYPDRAEFSDVPESKWYYDAVCLLGAGGIILPEGDEARPGEELTRGEFIAMLSRFYPDAYSGDCPFSDIEAGSRYYSDIAKASAYGWISGYEDGTFRPEKAITRAEAVSVLNNVLCRNADSGYCSEIILPLFSDVSEKSWYYKDVMEAALSHTASVSGSSEEVWLTVDTAPLRRPAGFYYDGSDFCYVDEESGLPVKNRTVGSLFFGADGRYTSGNSEIDGYTKEILSSITTDNMTREEMLRAAYNYTRDNHTYLRRNYYTKGDIHWIEDEALTMFRTKRGNCYCFASVFYYLSRQLGYDSQMVSGTTGWSEAPHAWVVISFDDTEYIYDTELEMAYRRKGNYSYDFFHMPYSAVPWPYYH